MTEMVERMARVEEKAASAHKRIDTNDKEILSLRESRHAHANEIQRHTGILDGMEKAITNLIKATEAQAQKISDNTKVLSDFRVMAATAILMGGGFIGFVVFVGGNILKWW